jgi:hypothetical protein
MKNLAAGANPMLIKRGIEAATRAVAEPSASRPLKSPPKKKLPTSPPSPPRTARSAS